MKVIRDDASGHRSQSSPSFNTQQNKGHHAVPFTFTYETRKSAFGDQNSAYGKTHVDAFATPMKSPRDSAFGKHLDLTALHHIRIRAGLRVAAEYISIHRT